MRKEMEALASTEPGSDAAPPSTEEDGGGGGVADEGECTAEAKAGIMRSVGLNHSLPEQNEYERV